MGGRLAAALLAWLVIAPVASARDWVGTPSNVSGQTVLSHGELIYTDWLYDDYGPNLDGLPNGPPEQEMQGFNPTEGDYRYPDDPDRYGYNAADLRELRVAADDDGLHLRIGLETMTAPDAAIATFAIDGDPGSIPVWPDGSGIVTPGPERFVTTWGTGARLTTAAGTTDLTSTVDLDENEIDVDVPWSKLGDLGPSAKVWLVTGINDGSGHYDPPPTAGAPPVGPRANVYNVAFRPDEPLTTLGSAWNENAQAAALVTRDVTQFGHELDVAALRAGESRPPPTLEPGFHVRIFRARHDLGDGIAMVSGADQFNGLPEMLSRWQPYGLYVPKGFDPRTPTPATVWVHSGSSNHSQFPRIGPHLFEQLGDARHALIVEPLTRGGTTGALDAGFADIVEALDDAERALPVDRRRVTIAGQSEGGYAAYRLGLLLPDRFARAAVIDGVLTPAPVVSKPKWQAIGDANLIVENARNVPFQITHVVPDELEPVTSVQHQADTFRADHNVYRLIIYAAGDHFSSVQVDEWTREQEWLGDARSPRNPRRVIFKRYPAMDLPRFGLRFDHAYWLSHVGARVHAARTDFALVNARTWGRGSRGVKSEPYGPEPITTPTRGPGTLTGQRRRLGTPTEHRNRLDVRLTNTAHATFALKRMGLSPRRCLVVRANSDGPARLRLRSRGRLTKIVKVAAGSSRTRVCPRR